MTLESTAAPPIIANILPERPVRLEEMMEGRGIDLNHATLYRWFDDTRLKSINACAVPSVAQHVAGMSMRSTPKYVADGSIYRAADERSQAIDFYLSQTQNRKAAKGFGLSRAAPVGGGSIPVC